MWKSFIKQAKYTVKFLSFYRLYFVEATAYLTMFLEIVAIFSVINY